MELVQIGLLILLTVSAFTVTISDLRRRLGHAQVEIRRLRAEAEATNQQLHAVRDALTAAHQPTADATERLVASAVARYLPALELVKRMEELVPPLADSFAFSVGWEVNRTRPGVIGFTLRDDAQAGAGHILISGEPGWGQCDLLRLILSQLDRRCSSDRLQIVSLPGAYVGGLTRLPREHRWTTLLDDADGEALPVALDALRVERQARLASLAASAVRRWDDLPADARPPRLVVIVALEPTVALYPTIERWLATELAMAQQAGMTYIILAGSVAPTSHVWLGQITTFLAGFQSSAEKTFWNIGMRNDEIKLGEILPRLRLPRRGFFTLRTQHEVTTVFVPPLSATTPAIPGGDPIPVRSAEPATPTA